MPQNLGVRGRAPVFSDQGSAGARSDTITKLDRATIEYRGRSQRRWQRQLLSPMWSWLAPEIGCTTVPARSRDEQVRRLRRLMALHSLEPGARPPSAWLSNTRLYLDRALASTESLS